MAKFGMYPFFRAALAPVLLGAINPAWTHDSTLRIIKELGDPHSALAVSLSHGFGDIGMLFGSDP